ncbi:MAG: GNAT family N-acetyltransferase [Bdellovibrionaceae bacterium]|nr:GNAT family N-acetyltransferase [Pseudobdellovibrionaceae bacterium]
MTNAPFIVDTVLDPTREDIAMHTMQVWLHAAKKIGSKTVGTPRQVSFVARGADGGIVGGLLAKLQMKVLYIESAWVNPEFQRSGVGVSLREQVFAFAKANDCEYLLATSYEFYDAINYLAKTDPEVEILGQIENCPSPYTLVFLKRKL